MRWVERVREWAHACGREADRGVAHSALTAATGALQAVEFVQDAALVAINVRDNFSYDARAICDSI